MQKLQDFDQATNTECIHHTAFFAATSWSHQIALDICCRKAKFEAFCIA